MWGACTAAVLPELLPSREELVVGGGAVDHTRCVPKHSLCSPECSTRISEPRNLCVHHGHHVYSRGRMRANNVHIAVPT